MALADRAPASTWRRWLRIGLVAGAALVALPLVALPVIAWAFDLGGLVRQQVLALKPGWEAEIGRPLQIGTVSLRVFPTLAVAIHDVVVQAEPARAAAGGASAEPLFRLGSVEVRVAMWPLLASLGKRVQVSGIDIAAPAVSVVKFTDGRLSYQDIVERTASPDKPPAKPMSPETLEYLAGVRLARAAITSASLHFTDLGPTTSGAPPAQFSIDQLDLVAEDARLGAAFPLTLDAAVLSAQRNLHLEVTVAPVPRDLVLGPPLSLVERVVLKLLPLEVEPLLRFVPPPAGLGLAKALLEANLALEMPASAARKIRLNGSLGARQLVLQAASAHGAPPALGQPIDVSLVTDLTADPVAGDVTAPTLSLSLGLMSVGGKVDLRAAFDKPRLNALDLKSSGVTFERIAALLPPGTLPRGAQLSGPIELSAAASGSPESAEVNARLDVSGASILLPGALRKPAGTALFTEFKGRVQPAVIDVDRLALVLGALSVAVHGTVKPAGDFDLQLDSIRAQIDPLVRLLPEVERDIPAGTTVAGDLAIGGHVKRTGKLLDGNVRVELAGAAVKTSALELGGGALLSAVMRAAGSSDTIDASLDLGPARVRVPGSLDKAAGVPMRIVLGADRAGERLTVRQASAELPGVDLQAAGVSDGAAHRLDLKVSRCDLDLARLAQVAPMLRDRQTLPAWLADARIHLVAAVQGDPAKLGTLHARMDDFDLTAAGGHVKGFAEVLGLDQPRTIAFSFAGSGLDFDRILGTHPASDAAPAPKAKGDGSEPVVPRFVKSLVLDGKLSLDRGRIKGVSFANLVGDLHMSGGKGEFRALHLDMFGGQVLADGSTVDVNPAPPRFSLHTRLSNIHVGQLVAFESPALGQRFDGHGNFDLSIDGQGLSWAQIAPQLSGQLGLAFLDGKLSVPSVGALALNQVLGKVPGLAAAPVAGGDVPLSNLSTRFHVQDGQLRTTAPLALATHEGALSVAGGIGLDQRLALTGHMDIAPAVIEAASGGRVKMSGPLPVSLKIGGSLTAPQVEVVELGRTAAVVASSLLAGQAGQALQGALGKQLGGGAGEAAGRILGAGGVQGAAAEAQKQLQAEAQKRLADEQSRVQQQIQQRVAQEAQKQLQQSAQQKIEEEARKRLGGGLGGLFGN